MHSFVFATANPTKALTDGASTGQGAINAVFDSPFTTVFGLAVHRLRNFEATTTGTTIGEASWSLNSWKSNENPILGLLGGPRLPDPHGETGPSDLRLAVIAGGAAVFDTTSTSFDDALAFMVNRPIDLGGMTAGPITVRCA